MVLLDANVLLELLLPGRAKKSVVRQWLRDTHERPVITMLTVHLALHFGFKEKLERKFMESFLVNYEKISLLDEDYSAAMQLLPDTNTDHEDALQLAAAKRAGCTRIVTLDKDFATTYGHLMTFEVL